MNRPNKKINPKTIKRLIWYIGKKYKKQFALVTVCIIISALVNAVSALFLQVLIDDYITPLLLETNPVFTWLLKIIWIMGIIYTTGVWASYLYTRIMIWVSQGILKDIRDEMFSKMQTLPIKYFDTNTHWDIMSHYTNDTDTLRQMISQSLPQLVSSIVSIVSIFCAMLYTNIYLTIFAVSFVFIIFFISRLIAWKSASYFINQQTSLWKVNGYIEEMINGQKVVKVFCYEKTAKKNFNKVNDELFENMYWANKYANILMPIMNSLWNLEYVLVAIIGWLLAINNISVITIWTIASFLQLTKSFNQPINQISQQLNSVIMALAWATRIFNLIDQEAEIDNWTVTLVNAKLDKNEKIIETEEKTNKWAWKVPKTKWKYEYIELKGHVEFQNVVFWYEDKIVLHDISLYAKAWQKIAFVWATWAGKTTITNLINRFYDIKEGTILYDWINVKDIKKSDLRHSLGIVLQDTNLFSWTIKENIKYWKLDATDKEVIKAAKIANAHDFISMLPEGYDTYITWNGNNLSQWQRQLLSIARAAIHNPPVMILDEATSSIDTRTEMIVQDWMDKLMQWRTVFVIAHRLSTVRNSKAIMVMSHWKIIERGNHEDLMKEKGEYYMLYTGAIELE